MKNITLDLLDELAELFIDVFNSEPWNDNWTISQARERLADIINMPKFFGMAEYDGDKLVALIMGNGEQSFDGVHFQILEFCVDKNIQGKGIGKRVLGEFISALRSKGIERYYLITSYGERTEGFYQKNGFTTNKRFCLMTNTTKVN